MKVTEDARILQVEPGQDFPEGEGYLQVSVELGKDDRAYFMANEDRIRFGTKSRLARPGFEIYTHRFEPYVRKPEKVEFSEKEGRHFMRAFLRYGLYKFPMHPGKDIKEDLEVGRFYTYEDSDILDENDLKGLDTNSIGGEAVSHETFGEVLGIKLKTEKHYVVTQSKFISLEGLLDTDIYNRNLFEERDSGESIPNGYVMFFTEKVSIPENIYGIIVGTNIPDSRHLNSPIIDPGFSGEIASEVVLHGSSYDSPGFVLYLKLFRADKNVLN